MTIHHHAPSLPNEDPDVYSLSAVLARLTRTRFVAAANHLDSPVISVLALETIQAFATASSSLADKDQAYVLDLLCASTPAWRDAACTPSEMLSDFVAMIARVQYAS